MPVVVTAADRASFGRCRRQWDFGAGMRQHLEPVHRPAVPDLDRAVRDALAVYYFPGMWDWDRGVRLPLIGQELERALARQRQKAGDDADDGAWQESLDRGKALLARYIDWAPKADPFAPVLVETDFEVNVLDPARSDAALVTGRGEPIRYTGRIDMMAVDEHDAYWIVRHRVVGADWPPTSELVAEEESLAACWAWEQFYLGMAVTGTICNELRLPSGPVNEAAVPARDPPRRVRRRWLRFRTPAARPHVRQHEPSGGGRSIPQHRRMYAQASQPRRVEPFEQLTDQDWLRFFEVNVLSGVRLSRHYLPRMQQRGWGRIVFIASTAGLKGYAYVAPYVAAKHGVVGLMRALAIETATAGITVNAVCPGFTETTMLSDAIERIVKTTERSEAEARASLAANNPQGRFIRPQEVADAVLWLCCDASAAITGQAISVSGGETW